MKVEPMPDLIAGLQSELEKIAAEVESTQRAVDDAQARLAEVQEQQRATRTVLARVMPETNGAAPEGTTDEQQDTPVWSAASGPSGMAARITAENGGLVRVAELARALVETGRYKNLRSAYGSAYGVLNHSPRFEKAGVGEFRDTRFTGTVEEEPSE